MTDDQLTEIQAKFIALKAHLKSIEFYDGIDTTGTDDGDLLEELEIAIYGHVLIDSQED